MCSLLCIITDIVPPHVRVIPLGGDATFTCKDRATDGEIRQFQWLVNGTRVDNTDRTMTETNPFFGHIHIRNVTLDYNNTIVQCVISLTSGDGTFSDNATLLVQGEEYCCY